MTARVGINGFSRMGHLGLRAGWTFEEYDVVQINEIATDAAGSAHLLKFDSVHGTSNSGISDTDWSYQPMPGTTMSGAMLTA